MPTDDGLDRERMAQVVERRSTGPPPAEAASCPDGAARWAFGLPGNPVSTLVGFELFVRPALLGLQGAREIRPDFSTGVLASDVKQNPQRDELIRVQASADGTLTPLTGQQSHRIAITALSDGLARIPTGTGQVPAGTRVGFLPFQGL